VVVVLIPGCASSGAGAPYYVPEFSERVASFPVKGGALILPVPSSCW
jgi:hypothetical protein